MPRTDSWHAGHSNGLWTGCYCHERAMVQDKRQAADGFLFELDKLHLHRHVSCKMVSALWRDSYHAGLLWLE